MRTTKASAALERLKQRSGNPLYSMAMRPGGSFTLMLAPEAGAPAVAQGEPLQLDEFVAFVNKQGPQKVQRISKLDVAFEKQLAGRKKPNDDTQ
jgi:hypothetical protein